MPKIIIRKLENRKLHSSFEDDIWGDHLEDIQLISRLKLRVLDIYSKYTWVVALKDQKGTTITNVFQKILDKCNIKRNKIWVDKEVNFTIDQLNHCYKIMI